MRGALVLVITLGSFAAGYFIRDLDGPSDQVRAYCRYGAVSQAQLDGCLEHATESDIARLRTNAARFARGEIRECRDDRGPFCDGPKTLRSPKTNATSTPEPTPSPFFEEQGVQWGDPQWSDEP